MTQLARDIRAGKFAPLYYFYGDDDYRMREATNFLAQNYLTDSAGFSGLSRLDLGDQKFDDIRIELAEPPFFGERKLVVVVDPQRLSPKQQDDLVRSLQPPLPDRVVVFVTRAARKPKKTAAFFKKMEIHAAVAHFGWLSEREALSRATQELQRREVTA
ncbi:MAG TPA: hypothetical protein VLB27_06830, partial [candidate division Zixibacteria bacterium]|nr:hypothetical protein [candidate division Zixibacteria bacterium]